VINLFYYNVLVVRSCLLLYLFHLIAFVKERVQTAVEIDILGNFGRVFIVSNSPPPKKSIYIKELRPRFHFIGLALMHIPT